ncbi:MAG: hypothetical protein HY711_03585 [Candidatus Melainabacteria bacterium]|nr:hypothetical protein [Candidatus Melainabacteria bacterium]
MLKSTGMVHVDKQYLDQSNRLCKKFGVLNGGWAMEDSIETTSRQKGKKNPQYQELSSNKHLDTKEQKAVVGGVGRLTNPNQYQLGRRRGGGSSGAQQSTTAASKPSTSGGVKRGRLSGFNNRYKEDVG